jgi:RNA recognition motif-containing protein
MDFYKHCPISQQSLSDHANTATSISTDYDCYSLFGPSSLAQPKWNSVASNFNQTINANPIASSLTNLAQSSASLERMDTVLESSKSDRKKLFVGNLPSNTTLEELIELFGKFGKVNEKLSVVKDDNYAFMHFFNEKDAELAHRELNDSFFKNRYIRVQFSVSQGHVKKPKGKLKRNASLIN